MGPAAAPAVNRRKEARALAFRSRPADLNWRTSLIKAAATGVGVGDIMRFVLKWIVPLVVVAGIVIGVSYFQNGMFHRATQGAPDQKDVWIPEPHPPGDRVQPGLPVVKKFGAWRYACQKTLAQASAPKVGYIQNFGIVPANDQVGRPEPCHVSILMRDTAAASQTMWMTFRYRRGLAEPQMAIIYSMPGAQHVIYDRTGQAHDMTNKKDKLRGGFFMDPNRAPEKLRVQAKQIPTVVVQLGRESVTAPASACMMGHCFARVPTVRTDDLGTHSQIVVRLPALPGGKPRSIDVPADGLTPALAELSRTRSS